MVAGPGALVGSARDESEVRAAYQLAGRVFEVGDPASSRTKDALLALEPPANLADVVVARNRNELIGLIRILDRTLRLNRRRLRVGGVTAVCVHPRWQGRGIGRALNEAALARMRERGDDLAVLFARHDVDGFYPRFGYTGIGCHPNLDVRLRGPAGVRLPRGCHIQVGPRKEWLGAYARAHKSSYADLPMAFARDAAWWRRLIGRLQIKGLSAGWFNVLCRGEPIGYYLVQRDIIAEVSSMPEHQERMIGVLMGQRNGAGRGYLAFRLTPQHWCARRLSDRSHSWRFRYAWDGGHMARLIRQENVRIALGRRGRSAGNRADLRDHKAARETLDYFFGLDRPRDAPELVTTTPAVDGLPVWSSLDEF